MWGVLSFVMDQIDPGQEAGDAVTNVLAVRTDDGMTRQVDLEEEDKIDGPPSGSQEPHHVEVGLAYQQTDGVMVTVVGVWYDPEEEVWWTETHGEAEFGMEY